jgi:hypothetical protein
MTQGRYERKYEVAGEPAALQARFRAAAQALGFRPDPASPDGVYELCSLYFDTPELAALHANADGDFEHLKYRIRRYAGSDRLYYEIKFKRGDVITKLRRGVPAHAIVPELSRREFRDLVLASGAAALVTGRVLAQLDRLVPVALVRYRRTALVDGPEERVCLDQHLAFGPPATDQRIWFAPLLAPADRRLGVVELKCHPGAVHRRLLTLGQFTARPIVRFSKYCEAAAWLNDDPASYGVNPAIRLTVRPASPGLLPASGAWPAALPRRGPASAPDDSDLQ